MGFTITRDDGANDAAFRAYARLLRKRGVDLGRAPRILEPGKGRRWLHVWSTQGEADAFAGELKKRTGDPAWRVLKVDAPPSEGPLGPIDVQMVSQSDGDTFELHPLSRAMIQTAFPHVRGRAAVFVASEDRDGIDEDVRAAKVAAALTGLSESELARVGFVLIDAETGDTLAVQPPSPGA